MFELHVALFGRNVQGVQAVFVMRFNTGQDDVGTKALHGDLLLAGGVQLVVQRFEGGGAGHQDGKAIVKTVFSL